MALTKEEKTNMGDADASRPDQKRPYRSPKLQRLGTVADLTLNGNAGSNLDSKNKPKVGNG
jgi:hypothetical protein